MYQMRRMKLSARNTLYKELFVNERCRVNALMDASAMQEVLCLFGWRWTDFACTPTFFYVCSTD